MTTRKSAASHNAEADAIMAATQAAMRLYAVAHPNWLAHYDAVRGERDAYINAYVIAHTTEAQRANAR